MRIEQLYPRLNNKSLQELLTFARRFTDIQKGILEKDLFVTGVLKIIVQDHPLKNYMYFKGGTALAKCHHITNRFSEDCDFFITIARGYS